MSRSKSSFNNKAGFLLLEVIVSIAMIAVGLVYVARSFSSSTKAIVTAERFLKSVSLAEERMWDLEMMAGVETGKDEGSFEEEEGFMWKTEIEALRDTPINSVNLKIEWKGASGTQRVSLDTYLWNEED